MKYFLIKPDYPENYGRVIYKNFEVMGKIMQGYTLDHKPIEELGLESPVQFEVSFANDASEKTLLPFYTLATGNTLIRKDFLEAVLSAGGSRIKTIDAVLIEKGSGREYHDFKFVVMEKVDIIDKTKKNYWEGLIVLKTDDPGVKDLHIFYINDTSILVDEEAKKALEERNIGGIAYYNPEKYAGL